jgi:hypothetical protein
MPDDAVRLADQFGFAVTGDPAEQIVGVGQSSPEVGLRDDHFGGGKKGLATGRGNVVGHRWFPLRIRR